MFGLISLFRFFKNNAHILIPCVFIILVAICLWGLNARNHQLTATNDRLAQLNDSKDVQINDLRAKNDDLAGSVKELAGAVNRQNVVMSEVAEQRAESAKQNRMLQSEIKRYLAGDKCAAAPVPDAAVERLRSAAEAARGIPGNKAAGPEPASGADIAH
ncbi:Rz lytic protein [Enterobacteriaceae bacterium RIT814]|nr:Rz lytic protein [Enterobacteriaceae bacterium RIT 814]